MTVLALSCPAKVNLFLEVHARRDDGYHEIRTVFQTIGLYDTVEADPAPDGVRVHVEGADLPEGEGNLAFEAARLFLDWFDVREGVDLRLVKRIPVRAGLGGGSSDAAGTLLLLRDLFRPDLTVERLVPLAAALGSDVPFFLGPGTALGGGRGEALTRLPEPAPAWITVFQPPFGLSTPDVYGAVRVPRAGDRVSEETLVAAIEGGDDLTPWLFNRLEEAALRVDPRVGESRSRLEAALRPGERALLSGSGSALFVLAGSFDRAAELAARLNREGHGRALAVKMGDPRGGG